MMAQVQASLGDAGGYEDQKRLEEKLAELKKKAENGGKLPPKQISPRENMEKRLFVHLVPHSHQDMGWVKTI